MAPVIPLPPSTSTGKTRRSTPRQPMATDFWKNAGIRTTVFNDSSLLTCVSNDYGYEHVFAKPIEMFANTGDVLFAISSSGESENILRGAHAARSKECSVITLSGFKDNNSLSTMGDYNFYVPSQEYGPVEIVHHSICHCILNTIVNHKERHKNNLTGRG